MTETPLIERRGNNTLIPISSFIILSFIRNELNRPKLKKKLFEILIYLFNGQNTSD
jgi:hypothetical protein